MDRTWPAVHVEFASALDDALRDRLLVDVDDTGAIALTEHETPRVTLYFTDPAQRDLAARLLQDRGWGDHAPLVSEDLPDEGWAARSQASLPAVVVDALVVTPPWDADRVQADLARMPAETRPDVLVIEPSMGFGTGHHQSTRLCLRALQTLDVRGLRVLDVGTGSGVLAIAAVRRGAREAIGIDPDPDAIDAARDSVARNDATAVILRVAGLDDPDLEPADLMLANLTGVLLRREASRLQALVRPGGHTILSGFTEDEARWVQEAFDACVVQQRLDEESWVALVLRRASA
jgi:ribosomal protein L11 methyltransferase